MYDFHFCFKTSVKAKASLLKTNLLKLKEEQIIRKRFFAFVTVIVSGHHHLKQFFHNCAFDVDTLLHSLFRSQNEI